MSRNLWKKVDDVELVKWLSTSAYLIYKNANPRIVVCRHLLTGKYRVTLSSDDTFTLADSLTQPELVEFFES